MNIERLRKIIEYSDLNRPDMDMKLRNFYSFIGMSSDREVLNIMQIARTSLHNKGYLILELPFADKEIGAISYKGDALGYILINTSVPKVNVNFAICHEIYHVFYSEKGWKSKVEFTREHYYEHESEFAANLFAGMLLMPEAGFRFMYHKFKGETNGSELDIITRLMNYYQVSYMAVLIRCCELGFITSGSSLEELLQISSDKVRAKFMELWLDESLLEATGKDDYVHLEALVNRCGREYIEGSYLNERMLRKVLTNMRTLYFTIKGE